VVQWAIPDLLKFVIILTVSFFVIIGLYEFVVRRFNVMRFLFGMKLLERPINLQTKETQLKEIARTM
jgi:multisubunit Na+/H+ antiporter MnhC subunit